MKSKMQQKRYIVGIDEVGRGPIAGPVCVGACLVIDIQRARYLFNKVKESKQLTAQSRSVWHAKMRIAEKDQIIAFATTMVSAQYIDNHGIVKAITRALDTSLAAVITKKKLKTTDVHIKLDGGLKAPTSYDSQKTYIKGDARFMSIALASIAAKVRRDTYMVRIARNYPQYSFDIHKGYGTKAHYVALKKYGLAKVHRKSFIN